MGRHKKPGTKPPRRGTKRNPFEVGEVVLHKKDKVECEVLEVLNLDSSEPWFPGRQNPVTYRVKRPDYSGPRWYTAREVKAIR